MSVSRDNLTGRASQLTGTAAHKRVRARISGRVQGVFFRASTQARAKQLGVVGWVRNDPDGTVVLEAEGVSEAVDALIAWCRSGPRPARVDGVELVECAVRGSDVGFAVQHGSES